MRRVKVRRNMLAFGIPSSASNFSRMIILIFVWGKAIVITLEYWFYANSQMDLFRNLYRRTLTISLCLNFLAAVQYISLCSEDFLLQVYDNQNFWSFIVIFLSPCRNKIIILNTWGHDDSSFIAMLLSYYMLDNSPDLLILKFTNWDLYNLERNLSSFF